MHKRTARTFDNKIKGREGDAAVCVESHSLPMSRRQHISSGQ